MQSVNPAGPMGADNTQSSKDFRVQQIGRYLIEARIGEGAMADVYRARDPGIGRTIAIKVLKPELRSNAEVVERFLREARAAGRLSHPHIVTIHDVGEVDDYPYIAMELVEGTTLDELIRSNGALPLGQALGLGAQLAGALHYAHEAGVIHRDIKPSNILIGADGGAAKILDFGIARVGEADRVRAELNALRTQIGQVLGTPRYMSPEQALGLEIDHRSDLFSLGVVIYEMLTGRMAFDGASMATLAIQITQQDPPSIASVTGSDCPKGVQHLMRRLLAKDPAKRFASGHQLVEALTRELDALHGARGGRGLPLRWRLSLIMAAAMAAALAISVFAIMDRQYRSMEQMALTSGSTISAFIANNVALRAAENAGLPAAAQDWAPVQAFVDAAAGDPSVQAIAVIDAAGIVRGANDPRLLGRRHAESTGEDLPGDGSGTRVARMPSGDFSFRRTIQYAGQPFGSVELVMSRAQLASAAREALAMMIAVAIGLLGVILIVSHMTARAIVRPLRQLKDAVDSAAGGDGSVRISHSRRDEFGDVFDAWNRLAEAREALPAAPSAPAQDLDATMIQRDPETPASPRRRTA